MHTIKTHGKMRFYQPVFDKDGKPYRDPKCKAKAGKRKGKAVDLAGETQDAEDEFRPEEVAFELSLQTHPHNGETVGRLMLRPFVETPNGSVPTHQQTETKRLPANVCDGLVTIIQAWLDSQGE